MHPRVAGRERELRSMADAIRRLIAITVDSDADAATTASAAARLHTLADELAPMVPVADPPKHGDSPPAGSHPHDHFQFDAVLGLYNPLALPVEMSWDAPIAWRGVLHHRVRRATRLRAGDDRGGVRPGVQRGQPEVRVAGPTAYLHVDYRRPTLLRRPLVFEGWWIASTTGRSCARAASSRASR
jgi:hypothetical protein